MNPARKALPEVPADLYADKWENAGTDRGGFSEADGSERQRKRLTQRCYKNIFRLPWLMRTVNELPAFIVLANAGRQEADKEKSNENEETW